MSGIVKTIVPNVYILNSAINQKEYNVYIISLDDNYHVLINSGDIDNAQDLLRNIFQLFSSSNLKIKYIILLNCLKQVASASFILLTYFPSAFVIAHYPDTINLRQGKCGDLVYPPISPSIEIKDRIAYLDEKIIIIQSQVPTKGSINVLVSLKKDVNVLFTSTEKVSPFGNKIKYICTPIECKMVL